MKNAKINIFPLDKTRWDDFVTLFGDRGACGGCWCMSWRLKPTEFDRQKGAGNKNAMKRLVSKGEPLGVLAYIGNEPVGWCAVAPRENYPRLENSRVLSRVDDRPVWSITCFFVAKKYRNKGISVELLKGVIQHCKRMKVKIIEGYPEVPYQAKIPDAFAWKGIPSSFRKAGFVVAEKRTKSKSILRYYLQQ